MKKEEKEEEGKEEREEWRRKLLHHHFEGLHLHVSCIGKPLTHRLSHPIPAESPRALGYDYGGFETQNGVYKR